MTIVTWPYELLVPRTAMASPVAFTRSGGRSLGGVERTTRTDRGFWHLTLTDVSVRTAAMRRMWNAMRVSIGGRAGLVVVPVWSFDSAPYPSGRRETVLTTHDDSTDFDDGSDYYQTAVEVQMATFGAIGATVIQLRAVRASTAVGIRFSYNNALYETGLPLNQVGDVYTVPVFPALRASIPADAVLECDMPTCLCHLVDDRGMDLPLNNTEVDVATVEFVEAVDYWNDLALGDAV